MKAEINRCYQLIADGFSLITIGADKRPNILWKEYQTKAMNKDTFTNFYQMPKTEGVGIVCGFENIEVIDVDLKVYDDAKQRNDFWNEYLQMLKDNIIDFENKFIIVETKNYGYHILYKNKNVVGNTKIAKLQDNRALIETRGQGGYVYIYDKFIQGNRYSDIKEISDKDREILWSISKIYNHVKIEEDVKIQKTQQYNEVKITVWDDYNQKTRVWDLVSSEFTIVKQLSDRYVIKRNGATSPHSGYIFKNNGFMYLFSTGTQYPNEKLITPFLAYSIQKHNSDIKATCKDLYAQGYGSRFLPNVLKQEQIKDPIKKEKQYEDKDFPIDIYPNFIQQYINEVSVSLNANLDYLGGGMLWVISLCVGNSIKIQVKRGWIESGTVWIALVGRAGVGKTHTIKAITDPLEKLSGREIKRYSDEMEKYEAYMAMDKKQKDFAEKVEKPKKKKFIAEDITVEALSELHEQNKNGIGILRDELVGWIKDMNKYREGSDLQKYLSCWSNGILSSDRKTSSSAYVEKAYIPIIGGVQPSVLSSVYTDENKDNGFIDRILLCYPDIKVNDYNEEEIDARLIDEYSEFITYFYEQIRQNVLKYDDFGNIEPYILTFDDEAKVEWVRIFNDITRLENSEQENEYIKSVLPKLKSYVCRFSLLLEVLNIYADHSTIEKIGKKSVLDAEKLYKYFLEMAKKNKVNTMESYEIKQTIRSSNKIKPFDKFLTIYQSDPNFNKQKVAEELNVSRVTLYKWIAEIEKKSVK